VEGLGSHFKVYDRRSTSQAVIVLRC